MLSHIKTPGRQQHLKLPVKCIMNNGISDHSRLNYHSRRSAGKKIRVPEKSINMMFSSLLSQKFSPSCHLQYKSSNSVSLYRKTNKNIQIRSTTGELGHVEGGRVVGAEASQMDD